MKEKFMNGLLTLAGKMQSNVVLSAIKDAFIDNMPVVIWGAFCTLFQFVLCQTGGVPDPKTGEMIYYISLANVPGFAWLQTLTPIFTTASSCFIRYTHQHNSFYNNRKWRNSNNF